MRGSSPNSRTAEPVKLSIVVPMYNEEEVLDSFFERIEPVVEGIVNPLSASYEIVCVDDGSRDDTLQVLLRHRKRNPSIKIVRLSRNFGKEVALTAGLDHVRGAAIVPMDADLEDPPEVLPRLFAKWLEGYDVVYAIRESRQSDTLVKRLTAGWFYNIYNWLADVRIPYNTGDFRLIDRRVAEALGRIQERNRFMKGLFTWVGFRQTGITYKREGRVFGTSKWRYWKLWNFALDGITASSTLPLRMWSYIGVVVSLMAFCFAMFLIVRTLVVGVDVPGYASLMVVVLMMGGLNLIGLGVIGEYLGRAYLEVKKRPLYLVSEAHGLDQASEEIEEWRDKSTSEWPSSKTATGGSSRGVD